MPTPRGRALPEEIVIWEILVRLPPKSLLRCHAVCRLWRHATTIREFLLAHHARQPSLPIVFSSIHGNEISKTFATLDHRAAVPDDQLQPVARRDNFYLVDSCDGLLILSSVSTYDFGAEGSLFVYNLTTRQHSLIKQLLGFYIMGMYLHRPTSEYRLLLRRKRYREPQDQIGCYVFALGSDQSPRNIGWPEKAPDWFIRPVRVRDCLHWYPIMHRSNQAEPVVVFDSMAESFRQMRAPIVPTKAFIFEMNDSLGISSCNKAFEIINIWVLQNYESEVWDLKYRVALPIPEIRKKFEDHDAYWYANVTSGNGEVLLVVRYNHWLFYVDTDGKLIASFQGLHVSGFRHKPTLIPHSFFTSLDDNHASSLKLCFI